MFFESAWADCIKNQIAEYSETMLQLADNEQGIILCPDCIVGKLSNLQNVTVSKNRKNLKSWKNNIILETY
jgi:hypothetical protein